MAALRRRHAHAPALADFAPLVDVTLMLVIFLLLTAEVVDAQALPVELPSAATGEASAEGALELVITASGAVVHDGRTVAVEGLAELVGSHRTAVLQADTACPHGQVLAVVDSLRQAGIGAIYYATEAEETGVSEW
jgi:biopolymer transport protein ExbD